MTVAISSVLDFTGGNGPTVKVTIAPDPTETGDEVTVSIFGAGVYQLHSPYGNASRQPALPAEQFEEDIDVNKSQLVTTEFPVANLLSATFLTPIVDTVTRQIVHTKGSPAQVKVINSLVNLNSATLIGTMRIRYDTYPAQSYKTPGFLCPGLHVVFYKRVIDSEWLEFVFTVVPGPTTNRSTTSLVTVHAKDFCTDQPVPGATVFINGQHKGITDINGKLVVGCMPAGPHGIKIQAPGYIPTDADDLKNDNFQL